MVYGWLAGGSITRTSCCALDPGAGNTQIMVPAGMSRTSAASALATSSLLSAGSPAVHRRAGRARHAPILLLPPPPLPLHLRVTLVVRHTGGGWCATLVDYQNSAALFQCACDPRVLDIVEAIFESGAHVSINVRWWLTINNVCDGRYARVARRKCGAFRKWAASLQRALGWYQRPVALPTLPLSLPIHCLSC